MFSDAQQRYIASLVATMRDEYPYYIAYSDYKANSSESPQLYVIFTKDKITAKGMYSYEVPSGVRYALITNNYSSYYTNQARQVVSSYSGGSLSIPVYEFVYTNATFSSYSVQPDINCLYGGDYNAQIQMQNFVLVAALLSVFILGIINSFCRRF